MGTTVTPASRDPRSTRGFTLIELVIAMLIGSLIMTVAYRMLLSGGLLYSRGMQVAYGRQGAMMFFELLESDLASCVTTPGHKEAPVAIGSKGRDLAFYRTNRDMSTVQITAASPLLYSISSGEGGGSILHAMESSIRR